ncbi:unnamed protein product, partial [Mesorhabditis belari]|uniref:HTH La-type RNA-binding domain-containing protein n=1 Tax=Mesorhabditis belari TaxID=2138241 RepID=A0AAF3J1E9_9BILA
MAARQPMLSFAKVVKGGELDIMEQSNDSARNSQQTEPQGQATHVQQEGKLSDEVVVTDRRRDRKGRNERGADRGNKHEKPRERRRPPRPRDFNNDGDNQNRRHKRNHPEQPEEKEKPAEVPVEPQTIPVVLKPAPPPAFNAWFRKSIDTTEPVQAVKVNGGNVEKENKEVVQVTKPPSPQKTTTEPSMDWPTLNAAVVEENATVNGVAHHSPSDSPKHKGESDEGNQGKGKPGKGNWKKIDINVDYGNNANRRINQGQVTRSDKQEGGRRSSKKEENRINGNDQTAHPLSNSPEAEANDSYCVEVRASNGVYYQSGVAHGWKKAVKEEDITPEMAGKDKESTDKKSAGSKAPLPGPRDENSQAGTRGNANNKQGINQGNSKIRQPSVNDYWHKQGGKEGGNGSKAPAAANNSTAPAARPAQSQNQQPQAYYQRNDRFQARPNVNAPPKLTAEQRRARGPLPDWDEIQEFEPDFDYMNLMDTQYAQYYALSVPQYDPGVGAMDPAVATMMIQQAQQHMAAFGFRPPLPMMLPQILPAPPQLAATHDASRPASVASSSTPAQLISPGGGGPTSGHDMPLNTAIPFAPMFPSHTSFQPMSEQSLKECVRKQIEYYFSPDNLQKDFFLRRKMNPNGFLPISLIASFPRVRSLTEDIAIIVEGLRSSDKVELNDSGDLVRPSDRPKYWPLAPTVHAAESPVSIKKSDMDVETKRLSDAPSTSQHQNDDSTNPEKSQQGHLSKTAEKPQTSVKPDETEPEIEDWQEVKTKKKKGGKGQDGKEYSRSQSNPMEGAYSEQENSYEVENNELTKADGYMHSNATLSVTPKRNDVKKTGHRPHGFAKESTRQMEKKGG